MSLDAHCLPFHDRAFDVVVIFEAIYYLGQASKAIAEMRRVLTHRGRLLVGTVNKDWLEFSPSFFSTQYFSVPELRDLLTQEGFGDLQFFGAFATATTSPRQKIVSLIRRVAVTCDVVPKTLGGRERLKRFFYGRLTPLRTEVEDGMAKLYPLIPISGDVPTSQFKVFYVVAHAR